MAVDANKQTCMCLFHPVSLHHPQWRKTGRMNTVTQLTCHFLQLPVRQKKCCLIYVRGGGTHPWQLRRRRWLKQRRGETTWSPADVRSCCCDCVTAGGGNKSSLIAHRGSGEAPGAHNMPRAAQVPAKIRGMLLETGSHSVLFLIAEEPRGVVWLPGWFQPDLDPNTFLQRLKVKSFHISLHNVLLLQLRPRPRQSLTYSRPSQMNLRNEPKVL